MITIATASADETFQAGMQLGQSIRMCQNDLKNREFGKEASQNSCLERATIVQAQGASDDKNFENKPTQPKPDSSRDFGIPCTVAFCGNLGAGKTTFIRGLAFSLGAEAREVCSPTFTYLNIYQGQIPIYHFDLYRMPHSREFEAAGFDEYLSAYGVCCIEWSDAIAPLLQNRADLSLIRVSIEHKGEDLREIRIE